MPRSAAPNPELERTIRARGGDMIMRVDDVRSSMLGSESEGVCMQNWIPRF